MNRGILIGLTMIAFALPHMQDNSSSNRAESPSIGLAVGQKAPAFGARDQFGRSQSTDTLKGTNGTVLLFFRSADW
jgi:hypothetical protein